MNGPARMFVVRAQRKAPQEMQNAVAANGISFQVDRHSVNCMSTAAGVNRR